LTNPYTSDKVQPLAKERQFSALLEVAGHLGSMLVTVNYGSSLNGLGGGEPAEAAAWVAYVNGNPTSSQPLGVDSKGTDWKTVGYWASLRAAKPLPADDGYNALRLGQPSPVGIQLWTVGIENWNSGYYSNDDHGVREPDLHAGTVPTSKDWDRHYKNSALSPAAYGAAVNAYVKAMKAVDPTIMVGATLITPATIGDTSIGKNWNADVLKAACASIDFGSFSLMEGKATAAPDWKLMDENDLMIGLDRDYAALIRELIDKTKKNCPAGHVPQLAFTNFSVASWAQIKKPVAVSVFTADALATLVENGVYSVEWSPMHSALFLDDSNKPKPAYYGLKLLHLAAPQPGDQFVGASSALPSLAIHAVKRCDGGLGLLLINKDPLQATRVTISVDNYSYAAKGTRYDWNQEALDAGKEISEAPVENLGATFTIDVPRYGVTALVIPKAQ